MVGRKRLPTPATGKKGRVEVLWGEVTAVGERLSELKVILGESSYQTKTRGECFTAQSPSSALTCSSPDRH